jgi:hypothetical protein
LAGGGSGPGVHAHVALILEAAARAVVRARVQHAAAPAVLARPAGHGVRAFDRGTAAARAIHAGCAGRGANLGKLGNARLDAERIARRETAAVGVAGAFLGGWLGHALGWYGAGEGPGIIVSVIGAVILLAIYRAVIGRRRVV